MATAANYRDALKPVRERLGARELQSIAKEDVDGLVEWMLTSGRKRGGKPGTGLSPRSVQLTLTALQLGLDMAVAERKIPFNPVRLVKRPKQVKAKHTPWTVAEVKTFLPAIKDDRLFAVMFLSLMGLRPEEVCGLKWDKVDLEAGALVIDWVRTLRRRVRLRVRRRVPRRRQGQARTGGPGREGRGAASSGRSGQAGWRGRGQAR